ncbi:hypothetical protein SAMN06269185_2960 [Natronoarchaeum philippinense]|uniref:Uncharacterized protein n=1 Tax=Natronoarchaeum philippinense TaxID=558529 RepID=A0A285P7T7_NATPI|nr:hypothetical protein [Natronoarchaeum philippinense]SNZ17273.1 hypothetical protein SAMN06269185_2960 [Natronoarchaeum philippinense]
MPSLRIDVSESVLRKLDTERDLLGFESREAYLRWILDHRTSIDTGSDRDRTLSAYADRVEELEAKLDADADTREPTSDASDGDASGRDQDADDARATAADDAEAVEHNLAPGEARITDDSVNELATELAGVEGERLDAFAREAVVEMGSQLQGSPESGLTYRSDATLPSADSDRPGEEITDLDELAVPGHDAALVERRRSAVGAALALLREREQARRSDFVDALYDERPAGYETADSWWGCVKRGLRQVDRVRPAGEHRRVWEFHTTPGRVTRLPSRE